MQAHRFHAMPAFLKFLPPSRRNLYRNELWGLTPINPACMKTGLLKYILFDDEGKKERSSLSFSCLLLLGIGICLRFGGWGNAPLC
jgi:hypothetical protein